MRSVLQVLELALFLILSEHNILEIYAVNGYLGADDAICWNGVANFARMCYFEDGAIDRPGDGKFAPENIDPSLCTHVMYAFAVLDEQSMDRIKPGNPKSALELGFYKRITNLKHQGVTVVLSVGGWGESTNKYSKMMNDVQRRANFVAQATSFVREHGFQGLDLDLEYPGAWNGDPDTGLPEDKENFVKLLRELRKKFDDDFQKGLFPQRPTLSAAVSGGKFYIDRGYDVPAIAELCDWIGVMTYDISGNVNRTGLVAPFSIPPEVNSTRRRANVQGYMSNWLEQGAPAKKLVLGIPFYGTARKLLDKNLSGLNAPTNGDLDEPNGGVYYEIVNKRLEKNWTGVHYNYLGSTIFKDYAWIGFDDTFDVAVKAEYIRLNCFFGGMVWAVDLDCFQPRCPGGPYTLLTTMNDVLTGKKCLKDVKNVT